MEDTRYPKQLTDYLPMTNWTTITTETRRIQSCHLISLLRDHEKRREEKRKENLIICAFKCKASETHNRFTAELSTAPGELHLRQAFDSVA
jgi:hypothetical protein